MENKNVEIINKLNHLIAIAEDGRLGYENAADDVKDENMKNLFLRFSNQRAGYISDLRSQITSLGGDPEDKGGPLGAIHRVWIDLKSTFRSGDKNAIINACITGEQAAISAYEGALKEDYIIGQARTVIGEQLKGIQQALDTIRSYRSESNS
jgi:uncharacterized protein (TIGR02284 family)